MVAMADERNLHEYPGNDIDVRWDGQLCIHVGECGRAEGQLFVSGRKPWCDPNVGGTVEEVTEVCHRCPTGALTYIRKDGVALEQAPPRNVVVVSNDGPLFVTGDLAIDAAKDDQPGLRFRAALCRCGASNNKPFCDNRHREAAFADHGAVGSKGAASAEVGGKLQIRRAANGPLLLNGNFTIVSGSGREAWHGTRAALCRCGASKNKPFCDGTHKAAGFTAE
jgi:CDGSH-type Zn-finger protein/uncharacterized Fe-S cluster protein YjdI